MDTFIIHVCVLTIEHVTRKVFLLLQDCELWFCAVGVSVLPIQSDMSTRMGPVPIADRRPERYVIILYIDDNRLIRHTLRVVYDNPQEGDLLMDVRDNSWRQLVKAVTDRDV